MDYLTILSELFIEVYNSFESAYREAGGQMRGAGMVPKAGEIREIIYWYASDYCDVFLADRIMEQIDPSWSFAADIIENADLDDDRYLYRFGEYITENELGTARHLRALPERRSGKWPMSTRKGIGLGLSIRGRTSRRNRL